MAAPAGLGASATIAPQCTSIAEGAFLGNAALKTIAAWGNVEDIAAGAFEEETVQSAVVLTDNRQAWEAAGFTHFNEPVEVGAASTPEEGQSGLSFTLMENGKLSVAWTGDKTASGKVVIPETAQLEGRDYTVGALAEGAFMEQPGLEEVVLPNTIETIGAAAFQGCAALKSINIPGSVSVIPARAFEGCTSLADISISDGVRIIGNAAFQGTAASSLVIPASTQTIVANAFAEMPNLDSILAEGNVGEIDPHALTGVSGVSIYTPYRSDESYNWPTGLAVASNHVVPYGVQCTQNIIRLDMGQTTNLFESGYLSEGGDIQADYSYNGKVVSVNTQDKTVTAKGYGKTAVTVKLMYKDKVLAASSANVVVENTEAVAASDEGMSEEEADESDSEGDSAAPGPQRAARAASPTASTYASSGTYSQTVRWHTQVNNSSAFTTTTTNFSTSPAMATLNMPSDPTWSGFQFLGWYTSSSGGTQKIAPGKSGTQKCWTTDSVTPGYTNLYAHWGVTVQWDYNYSGGSTTQTMCDYNANSSHYITLPSTPSRTGYTFNGWYTASTGGTQVTSTTVLTSGSKQYFAHWTAQSTTPSHTQTIRWHENISASTPYTTTTTTITSTPSSVNLNMPNDPSRSGYIFMGWYTQATGGSQMVAPNMQGIQKCWNIDSNTSRGYTDDLYAHWGVRLTWDAQNSTSPTYTTQDCNASSTYLQLPTTPTRTGYTFDGWYYTSSLSPGTTVSSSTDLNTHLSNRSGATTFYAKWVSTGYTQTVRWYTNSGSTTNYTTTTTSFSSSPASATLNMPNDPTRSGYEFLGWYTNYTGGSQQIAPNRKGTQKCWTADSYTTAGYVAMYAHWGVRVNWWNTTSQSSPSTTAAQDYNATSSPKVSLPTQPTRTGFTFAGWYDTSSTTGGTQITSSTSLTSGTKNYYARWTEDTSFTQTIRWHDNIDSSTPFTTTTTTITSTPSSVTMNMPNDPTRTGYLFLGWYTSYVGGTQKIAPNRQGIQKCWDIDSSTSRGYTDDLYAHWGKRITWDAQNSTSPTYSTLDANASSSAKVTLPATPSRTGYTFDGWYLTSTYSPSSKIDATTLISNLGGDSAGNVTAYAKWDAIPDTQTVRWYTNISSSTSYTTTSTTITSTPSSVTLSMPDDPTRSGYVFLGWYTNSTGGTQQIAPNRKGTQKCWVIDSLTTVGYTPLYAHWGVELTWNYNYPGGSSVTTKGDMNVSSPKVQMPATPSRTNWSFAGWYSTSATTGGTQITSSSTLPPEATTYYARWTQTTNQCTIRWDYNYSGGPSATTTSPQSWAVNTSPPTVVKPTNPTRSGYTFLGWYTASTGGSLKISASSSTPAWDTYNTSPGYTTLYAHWGVTLTWNYNYTGAPTATTTTVDANGTSSPKVQLPSTPSRTNYTFMGWYDTSATTGGNQATSTTALPAGAKTYYARWSQANYQCQVRWDYNYSGASSPVNTSPQTWAVGTSAPKLTIPSNPSRSGYTFKGWYTSPTGGTLKVSGSGDSINAWDTLGTTAGYAVLYAHWGVTLNWNYNYPGGSSATTNVDMNVSSPKVQLPATPSRTNWSFVGWYDTSATTGGNQITSSTALPSGTKTYYARWSQTTNQCTIRWDYNYSGASSPVNTSPQTWTVGTTPPTVNTPSNPTRSGYNFLGWYDSPTGGTYKVGPVGSTPTYAWDNYNSSPGYTTLYAHWSVALTWNYNYPGGSSTTTSVDANGTSSPKVQLPSTPSRTNWSFVGWYDTSATTGGNQITSSTALPSGAKTYYARWTQTTNQCTIRWDYNYSGGPSATTTSPQSWAVNTSPPTVVKPTNPTRSGYTFLGWYTASTGGSLKIGASSSTPAWDTYNTSPGYQTLYAHWGVELTWNYNYTGAPTATTTTVDANGTSSPKVQLPSQPSRTNYTFEGWYDTAATTGGNQATSTTALPAGAKTYYARWTQSSYQCQIRWDYNYAGASSPSPTAPQTWAVGSSAPKLTIPANPSRSGYVFMGWYDSPTGGTRKVAGSGDSVTAWNTLGTTAGYAILYAHWGIELTWDYNYPGAPAATTTTVDANGTSSPKVVLPATPTRTNWSFTNWSTSTSSPSMGQINSSSALPTSATIYYAHWTQTTNQCQIRWNYNYAGASSPFNTSPQTWNVGTTPPTLNKPSDPSRSGYKFMGWYTQAYGGTLKVGATGTTAANAYAWDTYNTSPGYTTLYAHWGVELTWNYNYPGGSSTTTTVDANSSSSPTVQLPSTPSRTNWSFVGWYDTSATTGGNQITGTTALPTSAKTYYARWTQSTNQCTIRWDYNYSGSPSAVNTSPQTWAVGTSAPVVNKPSDPSRSGYKFMGWYTQATGGTLKVGATGTTAANATAWDNYNTSPGYTTLYAHWGVELTWNYNYTGAPPALKDVQDTNAAASGGPLTVKLPSQPIRTGYTFAGWYDTDATTGGTQVTDKTPMPTGAKTYYARWSHSTKCEVHWYANDGGSTTPLKSTSQTWATGTTPPSVERPADPSRNGFVFLGWYTAPTGGTKMVPSTSTSNVNCWDTSSTSPGYTSLYAHWGVEVTWNYNYAGAPTATKGSYDYNQSASHTILLPPTPVRASYVFAGWYDTSASTGGNQITNSTVLTAGAKTYYARWTKDAFKDGCIVNWVINAGSLSPDYRSSQEWHVNEAAPTIQQPGDPERFGYKFMGWYTASTGGTMKVPPNGSTPVKCWSTTNSSPGYDTLYAHWGVDVTWDYNYTDAPPAMKETQDYNATSGHTVVLPSQPVRSGYTFVGWFTTSISGGEKVTASTVLSAGAKTYYARWTKEEGTAVCAVHWFKNDGTSGSTTTPIKTTEQSWVNGSKAPQLEKPTDPTRAGYVFLGWYDSSTGGSQLAGGTNETNLCWDNSTTTPGYTNLYAHWGIELTWNYNYEGAPAAAKTSVDSNVSSPTVKLPSEPTRMGYEFAGWYTTSISGGSEVTNSTALPTSATTYYARWTYVVPGTATMTVEWYPNQGSTTSMSKTQSDFPAGNTNPDSLLEMPDDPTRGGFSFLGWYTAATGGTKMIEPGQQGIAKVGDAVETMTGNDQTVKLYAHWGVELTWDYNYTAAPPAVKRVQDYNAVANPKVTLPAEPTRTGYTFAGWFDTDATSGGNQITGSTALPTSAKTYYARWTQEVPKGTTITVQWCPNQGSTTPMATTETEVPVGTSPPSVKLNMIDDITWDGHVFLGWYSASTGGTKMIEPGQKGTATVDKAVQSWTGSDQTVQLYAHWGIELTWNLNYSGAPAATKATTDANATANPKVTLPAEPTRTGYTFAGWFDTSATTGGNQITGSTTLPTSAKTYYARWTQDAPAAATVTVKWHANDGSSTTPAETTTEVAVGTTPAQVELNMADNPSRDGYRFLGWYTAATDGAKKIESYDVGTKVGDVVENWSGNDQTVELYAHWGAPLLWNHNYEGATTDVTYGDVNTSNPKVVLPSNPARTDYTFVGWFDTAAETGGSQITAETALPSKGAKYFARWTQEAPKTYTITFNANDGVGTVPAPITATFGKSETIAEPNLTKPGHVFDGWTDAAGNKYGKTGPFLDLTDEPGGTVELTAHYTAKTTTVSMAGDSVTGNPLGAQTLTFTYGQPIPELTSYTAPADKAGFYLGGWTYNGTKYYDGAGAKEFTGTWTPAEVVPASITLAPEWLAIGLTVEYAAGTQGNGTQKPDSFKYGEGHKLPACSFTANDGYLFDGWSITAGGTTATYQAGASVDDVVKAHKVTNGTTITATALWKEKPIEYVTITWDDGDGNVVATTTPAMGQTIAAPTTDPTKENWLFKGWATVKGDASTLVTFDDSLKASADVTYYAIWEQPWFLMTLQGNGTEYAGTLKSSISRYNNAADVTEQDRRANKVFSLNGDTAAYLWVQYGVHGFNLPAVTDVFECAGATPQSAWKVLAGDHTGTMNAGTEIGFGAGSPSFEQLYEGISQNEISHTVLKACFDPALAITVPVRADILLDADDPDDETKNGCERDFTSGSAAPMEITEISDISTADQKSEAADAMKEMLGESDFNTAVLKIIDKADPGTGYQLALNGWAGLPLNEDKPLVVGAGVGSTLTARYTVQNYNPANLTISAQMQVAKLKYLIQIHE